VYIPVRILLAVVLLAASVPICIADIRRRRIPDVWSIGGAVAAFLVTLAMGRARLPENTAGAAIAFAAIRLVEQVTDGRIGRGDAKYSALIGFCLGPDGWFWALLAASLSGLVLASCLVALGKIDLDYPLPFAPLLAAGSFFSISCADQLTAAVLGRPA